LAAWVAIDWWQRQPGPTFYGDGIPLLAWYALGVLVVAVLLRWRSTPQPATAATVVLVLGLVPLPLLLVSVAAYYLPAIWFWATAFLIALYSVNYLWRGMRTLTGRRQRAATIVGFIAIVAFIGVSDWVNAIPDVWSPRDADAAPSDEVLGEREAALFEQADRIDEALDSIHRDTSAHPQGFFLGFAGVGDEKVFAQEIGLASRVLTERFGIAGRQLSLVNDERNLERAPLASVSGLIYALHGLAAHMQLDRDVLFLSISSHGSEEPVIAVSNSQFPLKDLTDQDLGDALRDAGIKWRVIIISACYAGGFIDSLRNPQTIVITAAAADRTSFGCSSDSDLTYFGEAFYRDALPAASSLQDAFERAKVAIAARERAEGETPSNPQAYFGSEIEAHLAGMTGGTER
jgi:Peptidase C13 family